MNTSMTLSNDTSDLVSLFVDEDSHAPIRHDYGSAHRSEAMSPSSTDSSLTNDDLVVLSDLFGFANSGVTTSTTHPKRSTPARPRSRKRPRPVLVETGTVQPKSQQQRQKLEIEFLKQQVVELQSTIEELHARKLERERQALEQSQQSQQYSPTNDGSDNSSSLNDWVGPAESQVTAVQQLEEQNEKLRCQVAAHLSQLKQLEQIARTRYLANAIPEPMQLTDHSTSTYSASC
ncbi:hypothetical protein PF005_g17061 [Phytophthora fragariae]|uniref:Uncharacterized protein n=1 Tax=Phytophthora fragariae TaxID=53985 RepID=A0A6A3EBM6_9STRA|nr:hypothetical protein PF003_g22932 [Phytophthora fragariae]KAE8927488.1 hypothetical protein PF009_g22347 [Phytophthora fragariae]KAE8993815.1 hypothetical protein PF011_g16986 [Phytophthora fragariae]KAE9091904.1 hypothetical protein PF010_g18008 [Phytophthora fragariae]KAE9093471.1 hypothetical protein PF007_g18118 [Phytophthora fragariae]